MFDVMLATEAKTRSNKAIEEKVYLKQMVNDFLVKQLAALEEGKYKVEILYRSKTIEQIKGFEKLLQSKGYLCDISDEKSDDVRFPSLFTKLTVSWENPTNG